MPIAPGKLPLLSLRRCAGVLARDAQVQVTVRPGTSARCEVGITPLFDPPRAAGTRRICTTTQIRPKPSRRRRIWRAPSWQPASTFCSSATTTPPPITQRLLKIAQARGVPFVAGMELSPSWGHFNAYPLKPGMQLAIDTSTASIGQVLAEARREGASVVQVNHPFIPYGYFASVASGVAPGGFDGGFDLVEINSTVPKDDAEGARAGLAILERGHGTTT